MKISEIRDLDDGELSRRISQIESDLTKIRFNAGTKQLANPSDLSKNRKILARLKTIQNERVI